MGDYDLDVLYDELDDNDMDAGFPRHARQSVFAVPAGVDQPVLGGPIGPRALHEIAPFYRADAVCRRPDVDCNDFFLEGRFPKGSKAYLDAKRRAKAMCATCPQVAACLEYAITTDQRSGIWGGKTYNERRKIKYIEVGAA